MGRIRIDIEIDETHLRAVMQRHRFETATEAVDFALRPVAGQPMTRDEALAMQGTHAIGEVPPDAPPRGVG